MRIVAIVFCFLPGFLSVCQTKLRWKFVGNIFGSLPKSIKVFRTNDSLNGRPFIAWYIQAKLKDKKLEFTTQIGNGRRFTPFEYYLMEDSPYVVINGTFFSFTSNQNLSLVIRQDTMLSYNITALKSRYSDSFYYPTRSAIGINKNRKADVAWLFTDTGKRWPYGFQFNPIIAKGKSPDPSFKNLNTIDPWKWWKMRTAIGGGPVLVQERKIFITNKEEQLFDGIDERHARTAMGYKRRKRLIILVIQGPPGLSEGATLSETAKILVDLKCEEAINLDGGNNSCLLVNGQETIKPSANERQQAVPGVFIIKRR